VQILGAKRNGCDELSPMARPPRANRVSPEARLSFALKLISDTP
jgi:hypothetical protein